MKRKSEELTLRRKEHKSWNYVKVEPKQVYMKIEKSAKFISTCRNIKEGSKNYTGIPTRYEVENECPTNSDTLHISQFFRKIHRLVMRTFSMQNSLDFLT